VEGQDGAAIDDDTVLAFVMQAIATLAGYPGACSL